MENNSRLSENLVNPIELNLKAVSDGEIIKIEEVLDPIFSEKIMGDGYGLIPTGTKLYSPISGKIEEIARTKHAIYLSADNQIKLLIHIGINTIELEGKGFETNLENGMSVEEGDLLISFDAEYIRTEGYNPVISIVLLDQKGAEIDSMTHPRKKAIANESLALEAKIYKEN